MNNKQSNTETDSQETKYLSIIESARYMGVHPNTIRNWIRFEILEAGRVGLRTIRIKKTDLDQLLTRYKNGEFSKWNISR